MESVRKVYSREFKLEAVRRSFYEGKPASEVARELGIRLNQLYKWRDQVKKYSDSAFPGKGKTTESILSELNKLRQELKDTREERDILKKTLIFFAKDTKKGSDSSSSTKDDSE